jgi:hypothetical protein
MARIHRGDSYVAVLRSLAVFGAGLAALVTPISATVLASVDARHAGIASAVNNALSRLGQMIAVATLPLAAGFSGADFQNAVKLAAGFPIAMTAAAGTSFAAALLAWTTIRGDALSRPEPDTTPAAKQGAHDPAPGFRHCPRRPGHVKIVRPRFAALHLDRTWPTVAEVAAIGSKAHDWTPSLALKLPDWTSTATNM